MTGFAIILAFAALLAGKIATRAGNQRALLGGLAATAVLLLAVAFSQGVVMVVVTVLAMIFSYSLVANGAVPFALSLVPPQQGGLGVGIYFGGFSLGMSLYSVVFAKPLAMPVVNTAVVGAIAFLVAGVCVAAGDRLLQTRSVTNQ
jgi:MFS family permease